MCVDGRSSAMKSLCLNRVSFLKVGKIAKVCGVLGHRLQREFDDISRNDNHVAPVKLVRCELMEISADQR